MILKYNVIEGEVPMSKVSTNTNLKLPLLLKPAPEHGSLQAYFIEIFCHGLGISEFI